MSNQNYQVNYSINVDATEGTIQVQNFANAVSKLMNASKESKSVVSGIQKMMKDVDKAFKSKGGKKRSYSYNLNINTKNTEGKLERVKTLLGEIKEMSKGLNLVMTTTQPLDSKGIKAKAKSLLNNKLVEEHSANIKRGAMSSINTMMETQRLITKVIGKINSALTSLEKGREVNIKTDVAKQRLTELLSLLNNVKGASKMTMGVQMGSPPSNHSQSINSGHRAPFIYRTPSNFVMPEKAGQKLQEKLYANQQIIDQKAAAAREQLDNLKRKIALNQGVRDSKRAEKRADNEDSAQRRTTAQIIAATNKQTASQHSMYGDKRRAAVNRVQYAKAPTMRSMPGLAMVNSYVAYGFMRSELTQAVEYSNIMASARSILKVADSDLTTFETRFDQMARYVRQIGVETKFTTMEIAGAVKYLSMAGMGVDTINKSIRPITNLALIGDNDVSQIADLATNIMAGYDVKNDSMDSVADILASTISRSNVNVIEVAESFKMAAGYLRMSGVSFSESSAAIGILGNMGIKGTMAGTALRAMSTRFAKPTKESQEILDKLNVNFTEHRDIYGKQIEKLRPIADIFEDLHKKGASMADMQAIFGKIGGNAAMMFVNNYDQLRTLTTQNRGSYGISSELAAVKQDTTKGLWAQVTSQLSESFMQGYETLEPIIKSTLRDFLSRFNAPEFARGLASISHGVLNIVSAIGKLGVWITNNFHWIEPMIFTGFIATKLFKLAGALTNIGYALGFIGKQSAASSVMQTIGGLVGVAGRGKALTFGNKRAIVTALQGAGVSGKGAMVKALASTGVGAALGRGTASLFATQVATGGGLVGAGASIAAVGTAAVAATAGVALLVGALGAVAYKTWKISDAKNSMLEEISANEKYRYPSIDALHESLAKTYQLAIDTKKAMSDLTAGKSIEKASGHDTGAFSGRWWRALGSLATPSQTSFGTVIPQSNTYGFNRAYQESTIEQIEVLARKDSQARLNSALAELGTKSTDIEVMAFMKSVNKRYGQEIPKEDKDIWWRDKDDKNKIIYHKGVGDMQEHDVTKMFHYAQYMNKELVPDINLIAGEYLKAVSSPEGARELIGKTEFKFSDFANFRFDKKGIWRQDTAPTEKDFSVKGVIDKVAYKNAASEHLSDRYDVHNLLTTVVSTLRQRLGSAEAAENIMLKAGVPRDLFTNEPDSNNVEPYNSNGITSTLDDGGVGGNYSGTGKLSSAAPKQVIVNITNLLSIETIDLMRSAEGQQGEIQNLKEQMAQALIDVVHDFDASWNG